MRFISGKSAVSIAIAIAASLLLPAVSLSATPDDRPGGSIVQLAGRDGCLVDRGMERRIENRERTRLTTGFDAVFLEEPDCSLRRFCRRRLLQRCAVRRQRQERRALEG